MKIITLAMIAGFSILVFNACTTIPSTKSNLHVCGRVCDGNVESFKDDDIQCICRRHERVAMDSFDSSEDQQHE